MTMPSDSPDDEDLVDLDTAARLCGLSSEAILEYSRTRIITVTRGGGDQPVPALDAVSLHRLRRIESLHRDWSMPPGAIGLVMSLFDRLEAAEKELRAMEERLR